MAVSDVFSVGRDVRSCDKARRPVPCTWNQCLVATFAMKRRF